MLVVEDCANLQEGGQAKFGWGNGTMGIEGTHVDDESGLVQAFAFDKGFGIWEAGMQGNKASGKKGVQHGLDKGAVGSFLSRGASIGKEEATRGSGLPNS